MSQIYHVLLAVILTVSSVFSLAEERDESEIVNVHETDPEMNAAMLKANQSLYTFIDRFNNPHEGDSNFALKVMVSDEYGVEHFWVTELAITENGFSGFISNEAQTVKVVSMGQKVNFGPDIITDWSYDHNGVKQGAFTLRVLIKKMPKEQADYYKNAVGWQ
jgi:uncharacterized protein YegJ (DUF2314 family)